MPSMLMLNEQQAVNNNSGNNNTFNPLLCFGLIYAFTPKSYNTVGVYILSMVAAFGNPTHNPSSVNILITS